LFTDLPCSGQALPVLQGDEFKIPIEDLRKLRISRIISSYP
jgi:hypothetical protein